MKLKDSLTQTEAQNKYKQYRNLILTLLKQVNNYILLIFFQDNVKNLKSTWQEIKNHYFTKTSKLHI